MTHQIIRISIHQTSKVVAVATAVVMAMLVLIPLPFLTVLGWRGTELPVFLLLLAPVLYAILAYLATAFWILVFNAVAARIGGIELTLAGSGADVPANQL